MSATGSHASYQQGEIVPQIIEEQAFTVDWLDSGEIVLNDGDRIVLSGVFIPSARYISSREGRKLFSVMWRELKSKVLSQIVSIYSYETKKDRYRIRYADVYVGNYGEWLQAWLVERGWAWVLPSPWSPERNQVLLIAENEARKNKRGFWGSNDFKIENALNLGGQKSKFIIIRGIVNNVNLTNQGWSMTLENVPNFQANIPVSSYMRAPKSGEIVEFRGLVSFFSQKYHIDIKSHYQVLDKQWRQWYEKNSTR